MNLKSEILFYFTESYPYGLGESFVEGELKALSEIYREIEIFPLQGQGEPREVPANVVLHPPTPVGSTKVVQLKNWSFIRKLIAEERRPLEDPAFFDQNVPQWRSIIAQAIVLAKRIEVRTGAREDVVYYSFWLNNWALALSILRRKGILKRFICRVNGYDLYDERREGSYVPFRSFNFGETKGILTTSAFAQRYIVKRYPEADAKVNLNYLGVEDDGLADLPTSIEPLRIFSCGWVSPVKRVTLLAEALAKVDFPVHWTHVGDGKEMDTLRENVAALPSQHTVDLTGSLPHHDLLSRLKASKAHLFLHTSLSEGGAPVALQEALSYGIPVMATAVGGVPELVNDETGVLLSENPTPAELAEALVQFRASEEKHQTWREGARQRYEDYFRAEVNRKRLKEILG